MRAAVVAGDSGAMSLSVATDRNDWADHPAHTARLPRGLVDGDRLTEPFETSPDGRSAHVGLCRDTWQAHWAMDDETRNERHVLGHGLRLLSIESIGRAELANEPKCYFGRVAMRGADVSRQ
jgi:hypothetical protein